MASARLSSLSLPLLAVLTAVRADAAPAKGPTAALVRADARTVLAAIRKPGARAVLVNVWASWCEPCVEEMPDIVRFYKAHKDRGLRLVLISCDDDDTRADAQKFLAAQGIDFATFQKTGDDMAFIDGLEPKWTGAIPATFLFDGKGTRRHFWPKSVTYDDLGKKLDEVLAPTSDVSKANANPNSRRTK